MIQYFAYNLHIIGQCTFNNDIQKYETLLSTFVGENTLI
jgi:hypothetical protein